MLIHHYPLKRILMGIISDFKDKFSSVLVKKVITQLISDFGTITSFSINSRDRTIIVYLELKGEKDMLQLSIFSYEVT